MPSGAVTVQVRAKASSDTYRVRSSLLLRATCCPFVTTSPLAAVVAATMAEPIDRQGTRGFPRVAGPDGRPAARRSRQLLRRAHAFVVHPRVDRLRPRRSHHQQPVRRARALRRYRGAVHPGGMGVQRPQAAHQEIRADPGIPGDTVAVNRPGCDDHVRAQSCAAARVVVEIGPRLRVRRVSSAWPVPRRRTRVGATREGVSCPGWTPPAFLQLCRSPFRPHPLTPEPGYPRPRVPDSFVYPRQQCIAQYEQAELGHSGHGIQANREEEGWGKRW